MHIVLLEPEIPQNTGNIARTCAATGTTLHLVHPLGFSVDAASVKRAGLDYWHLVTVCEHASWEECAQALAGRTLYFLTTKATRHYAQAHFGAQDCLVFGKETRGLPQELLRAHPDTCLRIPMREEARSLNLANSVAVVLYEALRQQAFAGLCDAAPVTNSQD